MEPGYLDPGCIPESRLGMGGTILGDAMKQAAPRHGSEAVSTTTSLAKGFFGQQGLTPSALPLHPMRAALPENGSPTMSRIATFRASTT